MIGITDFSYEILLDGKAVLFHITDNKNKRCQGECYYLKRMYQELIQSSAIKPETNVIVDFGQADCICSKYISILVSILEQINHSKATLIIITASKHIKKIFITTGLIKIFTIVENLEEALKIINRK